MTRGKLEKAIKTLKNLQEDYNDQYVDFEGANDAYNMAIESLQTETCDDCISRQAAIEEIRNLKISVAGKDIFQNEAKETIIKTLDELPSVQPQKVGKWIYEPRRRMIDETDNGAVYREEMWCKCSECGADFGYIKNKDKYCKFCGAKMQEEKMNG